MHRQINADYGQIYNIRYNALQNTDCMDTLLIQIGRAFEIFVKKKKLFDKTIKNNP